MAKTSCLSRIFRQNKKEDNDIYLVLYNDHHSNSFSYRMLQINIEKYRSLYQEGWVPVWVVRTTIIRLETSNFVLFLDSINFEVTITFLVIWLVDAARFSGASYTKTPEHYIIKHVSVMMMIFYGVMHSRVECVCGKKIIIIHK